MAAPGTTLVALWSQPAFAAISQPARSATMTAPAATGVRRPAPERGAVIAAVGARAALRGGGAAADAAPQAPDSRGKFRQRRLEAGTCIDPLGLGKEVFQRWREFRSVQPHGHDRLAFRRGTLNFLADVRRIDRILREDQDQDPAGIDRPHDRVRVQRSRRHIARGHPDRYCGTLQVVADALGAGLIPAGVAKKYLAVTPGVAGPGCRILLSLHVGFRGASKSMFATPRPRRKAHRFG